MTNLKAYLGVARAPFLLLPVTLVAAGAAAAAHDGAFRWTRTLLALAGLVALHIAVNALNEASDFRSGIDLRTARTPFSGGSGTLPSGALGERATRVFALGCAAFGLLTGAWFLARVGWIVAPVLVAGAVLVLIYTSVLARLGLGELAAGLGLGALPVAGTALVQDGTVGPAGLAASAPAFFMTFNLLLLIEFPDESADREGGRRNLVTLLGRTGAARVYALAALLVPLAIASAVGAGYLPALALLAILPSLLLVAPLRWALVRPTAAVPIPALGANVAWNLATNLVLAATLAFATR